MRQEDEKAFQKIAVGERLWILVRDTNPASLKYIGRPGYVPKPIDCKAKTAKSDVGVYRTAGLVTDPHVQPLAFPPEKLRATAQTWDDMMRHSLLGYRVDQNPRSIHYGCLMLQGQHIHGDYDLYDIVVPGHETANIAALETLRGQKHNRGPRFYKVQHMVNALIGSDVVQHGAEMQYADDYSEDRIHIFSPEGEKSEVKGKLALQNWMRNTFGQRRFLSDSPVQNPPNDPSQTKPDNVVDLDAFRQRRGGG